MRKVFAINAFLWIALSVMAQDSSRVFNHEIGFNTVSLIKQVISNNPSSTLPQLPYDFFYNLYYKDRVGLRVGAGVSSSYSETDISGQAEPRTTIKHQWDYRTGLSYNFVRNKKVALNVFVDYVGMNYKTETSNTNTVQTFPNPVQKITTETVESTKGSGFQAGVGVKYILHKNLALYCEIPFTYMAQKLESTVTINDTGTIDSSTSSSSIATTRVFLPTTIYLVLRF